MPAKPDGPISGQSLTREPGNAPWEQPPMIADAKQALMYHMNKFENDEILEDTIFLLDQGFPLSVFVDSIMTMAVMDGVHTIDVSMLVAPAVHEYLKTLAEAADVKVVETDGPTKEEKMKAKQKERFLLMLNKALDEPGGDDAFIGELETTISKKSTPSDKNLVEEKPPVKGLIGRRS